MSNVKKQTLGNLTNKVGDLGVEMLKLVPFLKERDNKYLFKRFYEIRDRVKKIRKEIQENKY